MVVPVIPHELIGAHCCGHLFAIAADLEQYRCSQCSAVVPYQAVRRAVTNITRSEDTCPHCAYRNVIQGFATIDEYACVKCHRSVALERR